LDRAHLLSSIFSDFVADHPFVRAHPELRRRAEKIAGGLGDLYQFIGNLTLGDQIAPVDVARELGIGPKTLRAFLRKRFPRDAMLKGSRWSLSEDHVAAAITRWAKRPPNR